MADVSRGQERDRRPSWTFDAEPVGCRIEIFDVEPAGCRIDIRDFACVLAHEVLNHEGDLYWTVQVTTAVDAQARFARKVLIAVDE